jgi:hypothetical protein
MYMYWERVFYGWLSCCRTKQSDAVGMFSRKLRTTNPSHGESACSVHTRLSACTILFKPAPTRPSLPACKENVVQVHPTSPSYLHVPRTLSELHARPANGINVIQTREHEKFSHWWIGCIRRMGGVRRDDGSGRREWVGV